MAKIDDFFENLSLMKFSEIFIMKTTNNGRFTHQLKKQLKLVIAVRTPLPWNIYHFRKFLVFLHFKNLNNPYIPRISLHERIFGIEGRFKITRFFDTPCISNKRIQIETKL